eukprot:10498500-Alexandrium_andersonii.AAC.1
MSASLVGSEMCIRDSVCPAHRGEAQALGLRVDLCAAGLPHRQGGGLPGHREVAAALCPRELQEHRHPVHRGCLQPAAQEGGDGQEQAGPPAGLVPEVDRWRGLGP